MHFTLRGDSIANTHLPDTKDFRVFHSVEPSRLLLCTDSHIYVSSSLLWWLPSVLGNTLGDTHTCVYPCKNHNLDICQDLQNLSSAFMRQMKRTQAAVRTYQPRVTVDTAIQGISANGSKPGGGCTSKARIKGERESQVSRIQTSCSCGTQGRSWHFLNLAKGIDHKRPVTPAEVWPQSIYCLLTQNVWARGLSSPFVSKPLWGPVSAGNNLGYGLFNWA